MAGSQSRHFDFLVDSRSQAIAIIALLVGFAFLLIHPLLIYAQVSVEPRSLVVNSTMITKAISSANHYRAFAKSNILSYELIHSNISRVALYSNSSVVSPSIQIPSFTITNASLAISYDTLTGTSISNTIEQPVTKISKGILSADGLNSIDKISQK